MQRTKSKAQRPRGDGLLGSGIGDGGRYREGDGGKETSGQRVDYGLTKDGELRVGLVKWTVCSRNGNCTCLEAAGGQVLRK